MSQIKLGVVIVTYNSASTIQTCLDSLATCRPEMLRVLVVDNASTDNTCKKVLERDHADGSRELLRQNINPGFAAGVNKGCEVLMRDDSLSHFWVLNPDCVVQPGAIAALIRFLESGQGVGVTGGRVVYRDHPDMIQSDGGVVNYGTGATHSLNQGLSANRCPPPDASQIEFVSGACLVLSRSFLEMVGTMSEEFFLYYEEVDWSLRRGAFPIDFCPGLIVQHAAGASIGSGRPGRPASAFSTYFLHRSRMAFLRKYRHGATHLAYLFGLAKAVQFMTKGSFSQAIEALRGTFGLPPSRRITERLSPETVDQLIDFEKRHKNSQSKSSSPATNRSLDPTASQTTR